MGADGTLESRLMRVAALLDSNPVAAAQEAHKLVAEHPGAPAALLLLGTAQRACGHLPEATVAFTELVKLQPSSAQAQLELGRALAGESRHAEARMALTRAVELLPDLAEAWLELSRLHALAGETLACDRAYATYARLARPEQHLSEAANALALNRLDAAEAWIRRRLAQVPTDAPAMRLLADVLLRREDYITAERTLQECLALEPGYSGARFDLARVLHAQQKAQAVLPLLQRLLALDPEELYYRSLLGSAYSLLGQNEQAIQIYARLLAEFPEHPSLWLSYGNVQRVAGGTKEAISAYRRSTELRPSYGEAWFCLANLKTFRFSPEDIAAMEAQVAREELPASDRLQFEFALGKAAEDAGRYESSFAHYARGNALHRASLNYDANDLTQLVQRSRSLYTPEFFASRSSAGSQAPDPIFIVGLPRSGSTLLEQILASHSQVEGTRELPDIPGFALEFNVLDQPGRPATYPQTLAGLTAGQLTALGERYLAQTRANRTGQRPRFIDKMPVNFLHVGLIHLILPRARIIDARRSPLGCCFANFKQHFQSGVWFSYSLRDIAQYYRDYVELMAHYDAVLPGRVHRVHYEHLVVNLESEVRRLLDYCNLPFEDSCLRFHQTRRVVHTASSEQVRQPLYTEGIDQWRHYEPWLGELKEQLADLIAQYPAAPGAT